MTDHPLTESAAAELWDASPDPESTLTDRYEEMDQEEWAIVAAALRAAFDAGREHERATNADQDWQEAEKRRTDIAESDAETLYKRCERIREERDVLFRQCEYALDRAEKAEADLAEYMRTAAARDPAAIAREVLEIAHEDETVTVCSVPDNKAATLARAVIELTATVKRVEALADDMDHDAGLLDQTDDLRLHLIAATHREDATRLRTALNGENHD